MAKEQRVAQVENDPAIVEALKQIADTEAIKTFVTTEGAGDDAKDVYQSGYKTYIDGSDPVNGPQLVYVFTSADNRTHHVPGKRVQELLDPKPVQSPQKNAK